MEPQQGRRQGDNAYYPWNEFDSNSYFQHNYSALWHEDLQIVETIRDFFFKADRSAGREKSPPPEWSAQGLDVGSGTNLYPAMAMLPFCTELTLWEYSASNADWLRGEIRAYSESWDTFWKQFALSPPYQGIAEPRAVLAERARVHRGSIFDLPAASWDIGTMFFVAESVTSHRDEFERATRRFVDALRPGAPFAAAFMENSTGYPVGSRCFPAVPVTTEIVRNCLEDVTGSLDVHRVDSGAEPFREGYTGMILAMGMVGTG
jgi:hypothetical protein